MTADGAPTLLLDGRPILRPGGPTACVLIHGFTSMPAEMYRLADHLASRGHTVLALRLAGHGTHPRDLTRTSWRDWLLDVEDGLALVAELMQRVVLIGQSLGGMIALTAAARCRVDGVVAMSTPFETRRRSRWARLSSRLPRLERKPVAAHPELGVRREADYPAYAAFPMRVLRELERLEAAVHEALPSIETPVLVIQSNADPFVPAADAKRIYERLGTTDRRLLLVDDLGHSLVLDPKRAEVFEAVAEFVADVSR